MGLRKRDIEIIIIALLLLNMVQLGLLVFAILGNFAKAAAAGQAVNAIGLLNVFY
ncbi:MAG: hypothetical protein HY367_03835 [Candidatus Aenigmarchaeota archaeon]|nr:hypothetical protein [Candidatus Aenigmarchaeota archaeon]